MARRSRTRARDAGVALVRWGRPPATPAERAAELRLHALVAELEALEDELEALRRALDVFERRYRAATHDAFEELDAAERLARRVAVLEGEVARLGEALEARLALPPPGRRAWSAPARARPAARAVGAPRRPEPVRTTVHEAPARRLPAAEAKVEDLKALYRRLARLLHPDLTRGSDAERARRSDLMARVNEAYARRDRALLELLAERLGAGGEAPSEAERQVHLRHRLAVLEDARDRLHAEWTRLTTSTAARLRADEARHAAEGRDYLAEARAAALLQASGVRGRAVAAADRLAEAALALGRARAARLRSSPGALDPVAESAAVVRGPRRPAAAGGEAFTGWLRAAAAAVPAQAAVALLAWLDELSGGALPPITSAELARRWELARAAWPGAPPLDRALASAARGMELGLRLTGEQLALALVLSPSALAGVRPALRDRTVAAVAREVLAVLGPDERCPAHGPVQAVHLLQVRGLDEVHGLACPVCGCVLRSYLRFGPPRGTEVFAPLSRAVRLTVEIGVRLGRERLAFGFAPAARRGLTAGALLDLFEALLLRPNGLEARVELRAGRAILAPGDHVPRRGGLRIEATAASALSTAALARALKAAIAQRFRG